MYIYQSHMGGLYAIKDKRDYDDLYCGCCGDSDQCLGFATTKKEALKLINAEDYFEDYLEEFLNENFGK